MSLTSLGFKNFAENALKNTPEFERANLALLIPYNISFLDRCLVGIRPTELVLIGAESGAGKTELATQIALNSTLFGKRVVMYSLEAAENEIETRTKYKMYSRCLLSAEQMPDDFNFRDFPLGVFDEVIKPFRSMVEEALKQFDKMHIFYREKDFGIEEFTRTFNGINDKADLVLIDHLHYFSLDSHDENREVTEILMKIRDLAQITKIPVVLVAHLRKPERREKPLAASQYDFHGTSNINKIANTIITLGKGEMVGETQRKTYFRIAKARYAGFAEGFVGKGTFDFRTNEYEPGFEIGRLSQDEKEFAPVARSQDIPKWYRDIRR